MPNWSAVELSIAFAVGGTLLAVAVPVFIQNMDASKLSEPIHGLATLSKNAVLYAESKPQDISFPPSAPLTPSEVPKGALVTDPPHSWEHLTWKSLDFEFDKPHAFSFQFDSAVNPASGTFTFTATAHGDLDGDGQISTFEVRGERIPGQSPHILPGMYVHREVE